MQVEKAMMMFNDNDHETTAGGPNRRGARRRRDMPAGGAATVFASTMAIIVFVIMPLLALAAAPPGPSVAQQNPRFANLQIDIWPEFDRRAALVILKGELAPELALPAAVSLRIPASSGGPTAVAFAASARAELLNLAYDRTDGDGFITLRFNAPQRFIHVEFYDPLATSTPERSYSYVWPADLAVERLNVRFQEPAASSDISVAPELRAGVEGPDGLLYRTADLGAREAGKQLPIEIRYTKRNSRTSAEILGMSAPAAAPQAPASSSQRFPDWLLGLLSVAVVSVGAVAGIFWWRRREKASGTQPGGAGFCSRCGNRLASGDRFCSKCGAAVRKS